MANSGGIPMFCTERQELSQEGLSQAYRGSKQVKKKTENSEKSKILVVA